MSPTALTFVVRGVPAQVLANELVFDPSGTVQPDHEINP
jgi:hypothetical protein